MKVIKILVSVLVFFSIGFVFLYVKFFAIPEFTSETVTKQYTINSIHASVHNDIVFEAKEDSRTIYINRGLEKHSLEYFQNHLLDKSASVTVQYFKKSELGRIIRIVCDGVEIY